MANYTGIARAKTATLVGSTVDTITFTDKHQTFEIVNRGTADIFFTFGSVATPAPDTDDVQVALAGQTTIISLSQGTDTIKLISSGTPKYTVAWHVSQPTRAAGSVVTVNMGDVEIGQVKVLGGDGASVAKVGASTAIAESDLALAAHDPSLGLTTDAATANTVIGRLKKLISLIPAALGQATMANSTPVAIASDQSAVPVSGTVNIGTAPEIEVKNDSGNPLAVSGTVMPVATESHLGEIGGKLAIVAMPELTRPADTTAYAALDTIADSTSAPTVVLQAASARVNAGTGYITGARIHTDQKTCTARFKLHIFHTAPTAINDNSPYLTLYANKGTKVGSITFVAVATEDPTNSTQAMAEAFDVRIPFKCDGGDSKLYILLETLDAFTPASGQKFYVELLIDQN